MIFMYMSTKDLEIEIRKTIPFKIYQSCEMIEMQQIQMQDLHGGNQK